MVIVKLKKLLVKLKKTKDTGKYIARKAVDNWKDYGYWESNIIPSQDYAIEDLYNLQSEGTYGEIGFTNLGKTDVMGRDWLYKPDLGFKIAAGKKSSKPFNITDPAEGQLDTNYVSGLLSKENKLGTFEVSAEHSNEAYSGSAKQIFETPETNIFGYEIPAGTVNPYLGITKDEAQEPKFTVGVKVNLKSGGLLDRKRS